MAKIHVLLKKEELDDERLPAKIVVVLDILFATSSIVTVLAHGAADVIPTMDGAAALLEARDRAAGSFLLSGELNASTLEGFLHPTPMALLEEDLRGKTLIYSTTNGTVALRKSGGADEVFAGSLLNGAAVVKLIERTCVDQTVLIVCAGSAGNFNLEDFYGAGYLVSLFSREHELSDAARAALMLHDRADGYECLAQSRVGRMMLSRGLEREVRFAAQKSRFEIVPRLRDGRLRG